MRIITSGELKKLNTLIKEFMVDRSPNNKNFEQLFEIFKSCYESFTPDPSNDLRILKYAEDMKDEKWSSPIKLIRQNSQIVDGIHSGIAYLKCIDDGNNEDHLPKIYLIEN